MSRVNGLEAFNHAPQIGSIDHLQLASDGLAALPIWDKSQVAPALEMFLLPESLANFIFENQTHQYLRPKLQNIPDKTAIIDTRHIIGYRSERFINAEYNYDPKIDRSYISILGRRRFAYDSNVPFSYFLHFGIDSALNLDRSMPIETQVSAGDPPAASLVFRTSAKEDRKASRNYGETNPKILVAVLGEVVDGFKNLIDVRDNR